METTERPVVTRLPREVLELAEFGEDEIEQVMQEEHAPWTDDELEEIAEDRSALEQNGVDPVTAQQAAEALRLKARRDVATGFALLADWGRAWHDPESGVWWLVDHGRIRDRRPASSVKKRFLAEQVRKGQRSD